MPRLAYLLILLVALPAAHAQEPAPPVDIAPILSRSLTPAALERVVGERYFKDKRNGLLTVNCRLDDPQRPTALLCTTELREIGAMREETVTFTCTLGLDGRVRRSGFTLVRGRDRAETEGPVEGGKLQLSIRESRGEHTQTREQTVAWRADVLPYSVAAFVAPLLELPEMRVRVFHPVTLAVNPKTSVLSRKAGTLTVTDLYPGLNLTARTKKGAIVEVRLGEQERYTPLTKEQVVELLAPPAPR